MQNCIFSKIPYHLGHHKHIDEGAVECGRYWTNISSTFTCTLNGVVLLRKATLLWRNKFVAITT